MEAKVHIHSQLQLHSITVTTEQLVPRTASSGHRMGPCSRKWVRKVPIGFSGGLQKGPSGGNEGILVGNIVASDTGEGDTRSNFQSQFPPRDSQSPLPVWGAMPEASLNFLMLRAVVEEAASWGPSLDTHPASKSVCSPGPLSRLWQMCLLPWVSVAWSHAFLLDSIRIRPWYFWVTWQFISTLETRGFMWMSLWMRFHAVPGLLRLLWNFWTKDVDQKITCYIKVVEG